MKTVIPKEEFEKVTRWDKEYCETFAKTFSKAQATIPHYGHVDGYKVAEGKKGEWAARLLVASALKPRFITPAMEAHMKMRVNVFLRVLPRLHELLRTSRDAQKYFHLSKAEAELVRHGPVYDHVVPVGRFDGVVDPQNGLRVYELNLNCPAGGGWGDFVYDIIRRFPAFKEFKKKYTLRLHLNWQKPMLETLLKNYRAWGGKETHPKILILRWKGQYNQDSDFFAQEFQKLGYHAASGDATQVHYDGKSLRYHGTAYDLVLRWFDLDHVYEVKEKYRDIMRAYFDNAVCIVNPFVSSVMAHKAFFAFFTDERFSDHITKEEREALGNMCPWTRILEDRRTIGMDGKEYDLLKYAAEQKNRLVIKRSISTYGKDIFIGTEMTGAAWGRHIKKTVREGGWIAQERVTLERGYEPMVKNGRVGKELMYRDMDPYVFDGMYNKSIGRFSPNLVTNGIQGGAVQIVGTVT